jgi:hypothetical protein
MVSLLLPSKRVANQVAIQLEAVDGTVNTEDLSLGGGSEVSAPEAELLTNQREGVPQKVVGEKLNCSMSPAEGRGKS